MAVEYGKNKTAVEKADDLKKRLGPSMNGLKPGYRPEPKSKPKIKRNSLAIQANF